MVTNAKMKRVCIHHFFLLFACILGFNYPLQAQEDNHVSSLKIGIIAPLSGSSSYFGKVQLNGIKLKLDKTEIKVIYTQYDDKGNPQTIPDIFKQINNNNTMVVIGPMDSDVTAVAKEFSEKYKIPVISPCATADYLTKDNNSKWFFRANTSDTQRAQDLATWMIQRYESKGFLIIHETRSEEDKQNKRQALYGEASASDVIKELRKQNQPLSTIEFLRNGFDESNLNETFKKINVGVGAIAILARSEEAKKIITQIRQKHNSIPIFLLSPGKNLFDNSNLRNDIYAVTDTIIENTHSEKIKKFRQEYHLKYADNTDPMGQCASFGYDAAEIVLDAFLRLKKKEPIPKNIEEIRDGIRREIANTPSGRQGLMSVGGFTERNELNFVPHRVTLLNGKWQEENEPPMDIDIQKMLVILLILLFIFATPVIYMRAKNGIILSGLNKNSKLNRIPRFITQITIENLQKDLEKQQTVYNEVAEKKRRESNPEEEYNLQLQLDNIAERIKNIEEKIQDLG